MIVRTSLSGSWAAYSECERYRYLLAWPTGLGNPGVVAFVLANPSTATHEELDPTLRRCEGYARAMGFGWMWIANARAWRETDPRLVPPDPEAIGPENDDAISRTVAGADLVVCGWGKLGGARGSAVLDLIRGNGKTPHALKLNADGSPAHPLYLAAALRPSPFGCASGRPSECALGV